MSVAPAHFVGAKPIGSCQHCARAVCVHGETNYARVHVRRQWGVLRDAARRTLGRLELAERALAALSGGHSPHCQAEQHAVANSLRSPLTPEQLCQRRGATSTPCIYTNPPLAPATGCRGGLPCQLVYGVDAALVLASHALLEVSPVSCCTCIARTLVSGELLGAHGKQYAPIAASSSPKGKQVAAPGNATKPGAQGAQISVIERGRVSCNSWHFSRVQLRNPAQS